MTNAKWSFNWIGNSASKTDSTEMVYIEGNNDTGQYDIVHQTAEGSTVIDSAGTEPEARKQLREYVKSTGAGII